MPIPRQYEIGLVVTGTPGYSLHAPPLERDCIILKNVSVRYVSRRLRSRRPKWSLNLDSQSDYYIVHCEVDESSFLPVPERHADPLTCIHWHRDDVAQCGAPSARLKHESGEQCSLQCALKRYDMAVSRPCHTQKDQYAHMSLLPQ